MTTAVFLVGAALVLAGAATVVFARNPVHSALGLVGTLFAVAVLFLNQGAYLLAAVQVILYTGAIVVLILFVLMLLGIDTEEDLDVEPLVGQRLLAGLAAALFGVGVLVLLLFGGTDVITGLPSTDVLGEALPDIRLIGRELFTTYVFALQITAALLTIAVVGAVVLVRRPSDVQPLPEPESFTLDDDDRLYVAPEAGEDPEASR